VLNHVEILTINQEIVVKNVKKDVKFAKTEEIVEVVSPENIFTKEIADLLVQEVSQESTESVEERFQPEKNLTENTFPNLPN